MRKPIIASVAFAFSLAGWPQFAHAGKAGVSGGAKGSVSLQKANTNSKSGQVATTTGRSQESIARRSADQSLALSTFNTFLFAYLIFGHNNEAKAKPSVPFTALAGAESYGFSCEPEHGQTAQDWFKVCGNDDGPYRLAMLPHCSFTSQEGVESWVRRCAVRPEP